MATPANDAHTSKRIVNDLDANFIVEAGAGTGKTYALVSRVVALVKSGTPMPGIVAITFTEAAAAELSERVRSRLEQLLDAEYRAGEDDRLADGWDDGPTQTAGGKGHWRTGPGVHPDHPQLRRPDPARASRWTPACRQGGLRWTRWKRTSGSPRSGTNGWIGRWARTRAWARSCSPQ